jgi:hypothetical protein
LPPATTPEEVYSVKKITMTTEDTMRRCASVVEAFLEVVRDGDRIVRNLRVHAQARRYQAIVE